VQEAAGTVDTPGASPAGAEAPTLQDAFGNLTTQMLLSSPRALRAGAVLEQIDVERQVDPTDAIAEAPPHGPTPPPADAVRDAESEVETPEPVQAEQAATEEAAAAGDADAGATEAAVEAATAPVAAAAAAEAIPGIDRAPPEREDPIPTGAPPTTPAQWVGQVGAAAASLRTSALVATEATVAAIRRQGFRSAEVRRGSAPGGLRGRLGGGGRIAPRQSQPRDPAPKERRKLEQAVTAEIPVQAYPELIGPSPGQQMPRLLAAGEAIRPVVFRAIVVPLPRIVGMPEPVGEIAAEMQKARELLNAPDPAPPVEGETAPLVQAPPVPQLQELRREYPPPRGEPAEEVRTELADVFARLLAESEEQAKKVVETARRAFASGTLQTQYDDLGNAEFAPGIKTTLEAQVEALREAAGIARAELDARVQERRAQLAEQRRLGVDYVDRAANEAGRQISQAGQAQANRTAGERQRVESVGEARRRRAEENRLENRIPRRRDELTTWATQRIVEGTTSITFRLQQRKARLEQGKRAHAEAYEHAAQRDEWAYRRQTLTPPPGETADSMVRNVDLWKQGVLEQSKTSFDALATGAEGEADRLKSELRTAGLDYQDAIRAWAVRRLRGQQSDAERQLARNAADQALNAAIAHDWEKFQHERQVAGLGRDLGIIRNLQAAHARGEGERDFLAANTQLTQSQHDIVRAFFGGGGGGRERALDAMATSIRAESFREKVGELLPKLEELVLARPADEWKRISKVGAGQSSAGQGPPDFDAEKKADRIYDAVNRVGTKEQWIFDALAGLTNIQLHAVRSAYNTKRDDTIEEDLKSDLSGREEDRAMALLGHHADIEIPELASADPSKRANPEQTRQAIADAIAMRQAMKGNYEGRWYGGLSGLGVDRDTLMDIARGRTPEEVERLMSAYDAMYGTSLRDDVMDELYSDRDREQFAALAENRRDEAYALELRDYLPTPAQAADPNVPVVADRDKIQAVYDRIRAEATRQGVSAGWDTVRLEAEITHRSQSVRRIFDQRFAADYGSQDRSALSAAFETGFRYGEGQRELAEGLANNDLFRADAARVQIEDEGVYASDSELNRVLEEQHRRAQENLRRDTQALRRLIVESRLLQEEESHGPWTPEQWENRRRGLEHDIDRALGNAAAEQAGRNMDVLRDTFRHRFGRDLDEVVIAGTSGVDQRAAVARLKKGYLEPHEMVYYAREGAGTNEDLLREALRGRTKAEIDAMAEKYRLVFGGDMRADIRDDVSGRDRLEFDDMLRGAPLTIEEEMERVEAQIRDELDTGLAGGAAASKERARIDEALADLRAQRAQMQKVVSPEEREAILIGFRHDRALVDAAIADHRLALDTVVERITTAIAVAIAVIVVAVITVLTLGVGTAVLLGVAGSLLATAATMVTKQAVLGGTYGWEEVAVDATIGVVDATIAALTAGVGDKLLGLKAVARAGLQQAGKEAAKSGVRQRIANFLTKSAFGRAINPELSLAARAIPESSILSQMAQRGGAQRMLATVLAEGTEDVIANVPVALVTTALDDQTWEKGSPLTNLVRGTLAQTATSVGTARVMGGAQAGGARGLRGVNAGIRGLLDRFGRADDLLGLDWNTFRRQNPDVTYREFVETREAARLARRAEVGMEPRPDVTEDAAPLGRGEAERRPLPDQASEPAPQVRVRDDLPLTTDAMRQALPPRLAEKVPVTVDPTLPGRTVKVEYQVEGGVITGIRMVAGPEARPIDIALHVPTVQAMRRYTGLGGRIRKAADQLGRWLGRNAPPPVGTRAWEARLELEKLPRIIEQRLEHLRAGGLDAATRASLLLDVDNLSRQVDIHQRTLDDMDLDPGVGYVAARGGPPAKPRSTPVAAHERGRLPSYDVTDSAASKPGVTVRQIGPSWMEGADGPYRWIKVLKDGRELASYREIRSASQGWVMRGSDRGRLGDVGEDVSWRRAVEAEGPGEYVLHPDWYKTGPAGFDGVTFRFNDDGTATVIAREDKNVVGYIPFDTITAVNANLITNLRNLRDSVDVNWRAMGLSEAQARRVKAALDGLTKPGRKPRPGSLEVEIVLGPNARLGDPAEAGSAQKRVVDRLRKALRAKTGIDVAVHPDRGVDVDPRTGRQPRRRYEREVAEEKELEVLKADAGNDKTMLAEAELAMSARVWQLAPGPLARTKTPGVFLAPDGRRIVTHVGDPPQSSATARDLARDLLLRAADPALNPAPSPTPIVIIDTSNFTKQQLQALAQALKKEAKGKSALLDRVRFGNSETGTLSTLSDVLEPAPRESAR
jgi:hypothetical protein